MILRATLAVLLISAAMPAQVPAQTVEKPLTNADIATMIKSGVPEGTVVLAIQRAVLRGMNDFDSTPQGLIALKNAGATEPILNFVLTAPVVHRYEPSAIVPGLPVPRGLYVQSSTGWSATDSVVLFPEVKARVKPNWKVLAAWDYARENRWYILPGLQAHAHLAGPRPVFYLRGQHLQRDWWVVRLTQQKDDRALIGQIKDVFALQPTMKFASGDPIALDATMTADDVVTMRLPADLTPGQYLVFRVASGQSWVIEGYAFEI